jgi:hypothetical protein
MAVDIEAVESPAGGAFSHVGKEILEIVSPVVTDHDATTAIIVILRR